MESAFDQILSEVKNLTKEFTDGTDAITLFLSFVHSIEWNVSQMYVKLMFHMDIYDKEPWIIGLLVCEISLFGLVYHFRRRMKVQCTLFILIGQCIPFRCGSIDSYLLALLIYQSERLNAYAAQNWWRFSRQAYFDKNGVFWSSLISGPLLVLLVFILVRDLM